MWVGVTAEGKWLHRTRGPHGCPTYHWDAAIGPGALFASVAEAAEAYATLPAAGCSAPPAVITQLLPHWETPEVGRPVLRLSLDIGAILGAFEP